MSRRAGEVTLTPAMARQVYGWIFEGREHLHRDSALLARFQKAGYGQPAQELPGQVPLTMEPVVEEYSSMELPGRAVVTPASERAAQQQLIRENAARAATDPRFTAVPEGVSPGVGGVSQDRFADPVDYGSQSEAIDTAVKRGHRSADGYGVSAGTY